MAELADAADSKSAGTWYLGGSTPPPGTNRNPFTPHRLSIPAAVIFQLAVALALLRFLATIRENCPKLFSAFPLDFCLHRAELLAVPAALALIETPMDFCGLSLEGGIFERGAAREHS
jgi:hypothetical protein